MKKIIFLTLLVLLVLPVDVVQAVEPGNFINCDGTDCTACNFVHTVNQIIIWLFGFVFIIFMVLMAKAGFGLVTSGGSQSALEAAKSSFQNAIIGLIIVMAGWLIVDTVMKGIVGGGKTGAKAGEIAGWGPWAEVQCQVQARPVAWPGDPLDVGASAPKVPPPPLAAGAAAGCTGAACVPIVGVPCKAGIGCNGSPEMIARLTAFHTAAGVAGARITEGMPPMGTHQSTCHTNGTCVDYGKPGGMTGAEIAKAADAARASGLRPVYEVATQAEKNALVAGGAKESDIIVEKRITAPHFSIYGY